MSSDTNWRIAGTAAGLTLMRRTSSVFECSGDGTMHSAGAGYSLVRLGKGGA
jgi:hypothetical protein